jgi:hypothetical protein
MLDFDTGGNFAEAAMQLDAIQDHSDAEVAVSNYTDYLVGYSTSSVASLAQDAAACYRLATYLQTPCIQGYVDGLLEFATPGQEYEAGLTFCESTSVRTADKTMCFSEVAQDSISLYSPTTYSSVCKAFPIEYQGLCGT